jgi:hypothetical protein
VSGLESNKQLVKLFRDAIARFADAIRREILPATGAQAEELKWNMYEFYLGDNAIELAGGNDDGARKLFLSTSTSSSIRNARRRRGQRNLARRRSSPRSLRRR